jgi:hypothetical protein
MHVGSNRIAGVRLVLSAGPAHEFATEERGWKDGSREPSPSVAGRN